MLTCLMVAVLCSSAQYDARHLIYDMNTSNVMLYSNCVEDIEPIRTGKNLVGKIARTRALNLLLLFFAGYLSFWIICSYGYFMCICIVHSISFLYDNVIKILSQPEMNYFCTCKVNDKQMNDWNQSDCTCTYNLVGHVFPSAEDLLSLSREWNILSLVNQHVSDLIQMFESECWSWYISTNSYFDLIHEYWLPVSMC